MPAQIKKEQKNVDHLFSLVNAFIYRSFITIVRSSSPTNNNNNNANRYNENVLNLIKGWNTKKKKKSFEKNFNGR